MHGLQYFLKFFKTMLFQMIYHLFDIHFVFLFHVSTLFIFIVSSAHENTPGACTARAGFEFLL